MKLLASDFDKTLLRNGAVTQEDLTAIRNFRQKGHLFGIITGRSISMITTDLEVLKVPYDFLVCNNGGILCDGNLNIINRHDIPFEFVAEMIQRFTGKPIMLGVSDGDAFCSLQTQQVEKTADFVSPMKTRRISREEILGAKKINSMIIREVKETQTMALKEQLEAEYEGLVSFHFNNGTLDINEKSVSKKHAIYELGEHFNTNELYVIGDGYNDLEMIQEFNGFAVDNAVEVVKEEARAVVASVATCIDIIEKE